MLSARTEYLVKIHDYCFTRIMDEHCKHNSIQIGIGLRKIGDGLDKDGIRIPEMMTIVSKFVKDTLKSVLFVVGVWGNICEYI